MAVQHTQKGSFTNGFTGALRNVLRNSPSGASPRLTEQCTPSESETPLHSSTSSAAGLSAYTPLRNHALVFTHQEATQTPLDHFITALMRKSHHNYDHKPGGSSL